VQGICAVIEATVFEDSDLRRLLTLLPVFRESLPKNVAGFTFCVELPGRFAGAQVFVDRICELVWEVKRDSWRYDNMSRMQLGFKRGVKSSDLRRFLLTYEYSVLHELLHHLREEVLTREKQVHSAAVGMLTANHS
jgi:hypothetical protein